MFEEYATPDLVEITRRLADSPGGRDVDTALNFFGPVSGSRG